MVRRSRRYKQELNSIRYQIFKANQMIDLAEAILDLRYKPSYWNMRKLMTRMKRLRR